MSSKTPVLLIAFNRPEQTLEVFNEIKKYQPEKLFIAVDGPRDGIQSDVEKIKKVKEIVKLIDWDCEIKTLFQDKNLGCKNGVIKAIDWFFENVEEGIIIEDDCLPDQTFFTFCHNLLKHYKNNPEIMHISGNNFQDGILRGDREASYYFSKYTHNWGWATWKRAWSKFNNAMTSFPSFDRNNMIKNIPINKDAKKFWIKNIRQTIKKEDNWDSLWMYTVWYNNGLAILPQKNLVSNIGFGEDATHTKESQKKLATESCSLNNIVYVKDIKLDKEADDYTFNKKYKISFIKKIISKIID